MSFIENLSLSGFFLLNNMENFNDLLDEINRQGGPLMWIMQKRTFLRNLERQQSRTTEQIKQDVMSSDRLKHTIEKICSKSATSTTPVKRDEIVAEARRILDEMAHEFDLKYVRLLGYVLMNVFGRTHKHIYYNADAFDNLSSAMKTYPTLLMPLHRSYMDFLLVSIVCFHLSVQLPAVAAGEDFLGLGFFAKMMRRAGKFPKYSF